MIFLNLGHRVLLLRSSLPIIARLRLTVNSFNMDTCVLGALGVEGVGRTSQMSKTRAASSSSSSSLLFFFSLFLPFWAFFLSFLGDLGFFALALGAREGGF